MVWNVVKETSFSTIGISKLECTFFSLLFVRRIIYFHSSSSDFIFIFVLDRKMDACGVDEVHGGISYTRNCIRLF